ncbi:glycosyltransferase [Bacteroides acidifaciens]|uniref:glycosyltransferase n=1 Tax=Bacteroides acidifaciens TaxID=85831 RepID=UPI0025B205E4|nr:glycosyltransferase [Bacteroides acidifaciens]
MKITFVIQDLFQQGAEYVTALMIRGFVAKGYEVDLLVSQIHAELLDKGDKPFDVPTSVRTLIMPAKKARQNVFYLRKYIKYTDATVIIAMGPTYLLALALAALGIKKQVKLAYVEHGGLGAEQRDINDVVKPSLFSKDWIIAKLVVKSIDCFMAVSNGSARVLEKKLLLKYNTVITVYNPVVDDSYRKKITSDPVEPWLKYKSMKTVCAAGAYCKLKDHMTLFRAIKKVNETTPVRLVLFGKGYLENEYKDWINENNMSERIKLAGHTHNLPAEIKLSDVFICSSVVESFSIVLIEALAAGVPVISTSCRYGPPEILNNGQYGLLVPVGDEQEMAKAILKTVSGDKKNVPEEAWKRFELGRIVSNYEQALKL